MKVLFLSAQTDRSEDALFRGLAGKGIDLEVVYDPGAPEPERFRAAGITSEGITFKNRLDFSAVRFLEKKIREGRFDIIHSLTNRALSCALLATRRMNVRHIAYRGTMGHLSRFDPASWMTYLHPRVDRIVCVSEAVRQYMLTLGIKQSKLVTIHKGHDISWYSQKTEVSLTEFKVPSDAFVVCYAGGFRPVKGVEVLLNSAFYLPEEGNIHYLLIGEGRLEKKLRKLAEDRRINDIIHFAGFRSDAAALMGACHVFVMPSLEREGLPRGVIEAMAQGIPAIVTRVGGMPEIVQDNKVGIVVPPRNPQELAGAIIDLYENPNMRRAFGAAAMKRIDEKFNILETIERTLTMYKELTA